MKFQCDKGHLIELKFPDEYFNKGPLIIPCPECGTMYEVTIDKVKPYRHADPLRYIA